MKRSGSILPRFTFLAAVIIILMCPLMFFGSLFYPQAVGFLNPILCPPGMQLISTTESISDARGNVTAGYINCSDGSEMIDVTGKMLIILIGMGILGVGLFVAWALTSPGKEREPTIFQNVDN